MNDAMVWLPSPRAAGKGAGGEGTATNGRAFLAFVVGVLGMLVAGDVRAAERPNVLFIAVDDLNDWVGVMGGHPQIRTPNLDRLAARGTFFDRAYCAAPSCQPSRVSILTGIRPSTSGDYVNEQKLRKLMPDVVTLPQYFTQHGYRVAGGGKIFHHGDVDPQSWPEYFDQPRDPEPKPLVAGPISDHFTWQPLDDVGDEAMGDYKVVSWASKWLAKPSTEPFFLAVGFYRPHMPLHVPRKYFDRHPLKSVVLPELKPHDEDDLPPIGRWMATNRRYHERITEAGEYEKAIRAYLASIEFFDAQLGRLIDALDASPHAANTVVVLWSDHGWDHGQKRHWSKFALWEQPTRVPLLVIAPGVTTAGSHCQAPVSLLDLYPTLAELCGLPTPEQCEGQSLLPQLRDAAAPRVEPAVMTFGPNNHAVRDARWRYIRYFDGGEELYDHETDPREWTNLAERSDLQDVKNRLAAFMPQVNKPLTSKTQWLPPENVTRHEPKTSAAPPRHLFLDPSFLAESSGVVLRVNPAERRERVIDADRPWEKLMISLFSTVLDDDGKLRMWYICRDADNRPNVAYAESTDGVTWTKPDLGIVDYHGSTANNLVGIPYLEGNVYRDPHAAPGAEYVYVTNAGGEGVVRYYSSDGLHWQRDEQPLLRFRPDTQNVTFWDERLQKYVLYLRAWDVADDWNARLRKVVRVAVDDLSVPIAVTTSGKGINPTRSNDLPRLADELPTVLAADANDPPNTDVYNISAQPYPLDPRWYVGFPSWMLRDKSISDGRLEVQFVGSRDGVAWHRYDRRPYAPLGPLGCDHGNMTFLGPGLVVRGDELWQYGAAFRTRHGDVAARKKQTDGVIYRYVQRVDGFVSADFEGLDASCLTQPVRVTGARMLLNIDNGALGTLRVGLVDAATGDPLAGFGLDDCNPVRTNSVRAAVAWSSGGDLSSLVGREVRVALAGDRTKLFSFYFDDSREGTP